MRQSKTLVFSDFSGGMNVASSPTTIEKNQAIALDNIVLLPKSGFQKRNGNAEFNSTAMASGAIVHGLAFFRTAAMAESAIAIAGDKIFKSDALDGTMDDITGSVTITAGQNNIWVNSQMNDISIFVGGALATDVPIKWTGTGDAAALGGTPPVGEFCVNANNRLFIGGTAANPSRVYWCTLGNPEDWSGTGSGSSDVSTNDGDHVVTAKLLGTNHLVVFKQNSIHEMVINTSPFPVFPIFRGVGAVSKRGVVDVDGILYFITPEPRMKATDGSSVQVFPESFDPVWDGLNKGRLKYLEGVYDRHRRWVMWFVSDGTSTENNLCIIWDLYRKCWLRCTTGHTMNSVAIMQDRYLYGGGYNGKVYELNVPGSFTDASENGAAINSYWTSGWMDMEDMILSKTIPYVDLSFSSQLSGTFDFYYGFDFMSEGKTISVPMQTPGALWDMSFWDVDSFGELTEKSKLEFVKGRGKFFQFGLRNKNGSDDFRFNRVAFPVKGNAPTAAK